MKAWRLDLDRLVHEAEHTVFRGVSVVFSLVTAHAIYWFFSALNGVDALQPYVTGLISFGFVALGYFVTRGLAHRLLEKRPVWSYLLVGIPYVFVEVVCNFGEASARYPDMKWIQVLPDPQLTLFSYLAPVVLSIIPIFTLALAWIDVDLIRQKGVRSASSVLKNVPIVMAPLSSQPTAVYPSQSAPVSSPQGVRNGLKQHWNGVKQRVGNGASVPTSAANSGVAPAMPPLTVP